MNKTGSPLLMARSGIGQAVSTTNTPIPPNLSKPRDLLIKDPDDIITNVITRKAPEEFEQYRPQPQSPDPEDTPPITLAGLDWDSDENWQRRFWARIMDEKRQREQDIRLLGQKTRELNEERQNIIQMRHNIEQQRQDLQTRLIELEPLISSSKQLKDIGIGFDQALVWIDCIREVSEKERVDLRTAAWKLADILRSFKELSDLEKAIQQATQQLAMLNMVNDQQKRAINTLVHLQQIGMTEDEIGELVKLVGRWNGTGVGVGQGNGNGISSMNGKLDDKLIGVGH
jgi:hypothetical protein